MLPAGVLPRTFLTIYRCLHYLRKNDQNNAPRTYGVFAYLGHLPTPRTGHSGCGRPWRVMNSRVSTISQLTLHNGSPAHYRSFRPTLFVILPRTAAHREPQRRAATSTPLWHSILVLPASFVAERGIVRHGVPVRLSGYSPFIPYACSTVLSCRDYQPLIHLGPASFASHSRILLRWLIHKQHSCDCTAL